MGALVSYVVEGIPPMRTLFRISHPDICSFCRSCCSFFLLFSVYSHHSSLSVFLLLRLLPLPFFSIIMVFLRPTRKGCWWGIWRVFEDQLFVGEVRRKFQGAFCVPNNIWSFRFLSMRGMNTSQLGFLGYRYDGSVWLHLICLTIWLHIYYDI